jgi:hypothetical protein
VASKRGTRSIAGGDCLRHGRFQTGNCAHFKGIKFCWDAFSSLLWAILNGFFQALWTTSSPERRILRLESQNQRVGLRLGNASLTLLKMRHWVFGMLPTSDFRARAQSKTVLVLDSAFEYDYEHHFIEHEHGFFNWSSKNANLKTPASGRH